MQAPFLKLGGDQQTHETDKRFRSEGTLDLNAGEVVEVTIGSATSPVFEGSASHRIASPQGAILLGRTLSPIVGLDWTASANSIDVEANLACSGTVTFLVF